MDIINKNALATAKEAADLADREFALRKQVMNESVEIAKVESEIAKLRLIANDDAEELSLRLESQGKAIDLIRKKYDIEINQARTRLQIAQEQAELSTNSIQDYEKLAALEVELIGLTTQRDTELRRVVSMYGTISNKIEAVKQAELDAIEKVAEEKRKAFEAEMADRNKIMTEIEESYMDEVALTVRRMDEMLAMYDWSLQERYAITKYWLDKINEIEEESTENLKNGFNSVTHMISGSLVDAINNLGVAFVDVEAGFKGMVSSVLSGLRQIVTGLLAQAIAGVISKETSSKGILGLATAAVGLAGLAALWAKIPQFATGGVVPQGYPNDSYLARLSSGEQIIPAGRTAQLGGNITISGKTYGAEMYWLLENYKSKLNTVT